MRGRSLLKEKLDPTPKRHRNRLFTFCEIPMNPLVKSASGSKDQPLASCIWKQFGCGSKRKALWNPMEHRFWLVFPSTNKDVWLPLFDPQPFYRKLIATWNHKWFVYGKLQVLSRSTWKPLFEPGQVTKVDQVKLAQCLCYTGQELIYEAWTPKPSP